MVAEKTVRDMIGRVCTDALYEIRHKPDVETVQSLIRENESMIRTDEEMIDLAVMRLALTNRMYMEYLSSMNTDKGNSTIGILLWRMGLKYRSRRCSRDIILYSIMYCHD